MKVQSEINLLNIFDGPANAELDIVTKLLAQTIGQAKYHPFKPNKVGITGAINTDDSTVFKALGIHVEGPFFVLLTVLDSKYCNLKFGPSANNILFDDDFPYEKRGNHKMRILVDTEDKSGKSIHGYIDIAELRFGKSGTKINPHITYDGRKFDHGVVLR